MTVAAPSSLSGIEGQRCADRPFPRSLVSVRGEGVSATAAPRWRTHIRHALTYSTLRELAADGIRDRRQ